MAQDGREEPGGAAEDVEVLDHFAYGHARAQRRDREVVAAQAQQRHPDQAREGRGHQRRQWQRQREAQVLLVGQEAHRVRPQAEEGDVAEGGVAGEPADQVPGRGQRDEHGDGGLGAHDRLVDGEVDAQGGWVQVGVGRLLRQREGQDQHDHHHQQERDQDRAPDAAAGAGGLGGEGGFGHGSGQPAQQALGPQHQHQHQDRERDRVGPAGAQARDLALGQHLDQDGQLEQATGLLV